MAVPDFQSLMLPLLQIAGDGNEHTVSEVIDALALQFELTDTDRKELLPSGKQTRFDNRVGWARTHLKKAELIESTGWGKFRITQRGLEVLQGNPTHIDLKFLDQFPQHVEFRNSSRKVSRRDAKDKEADQTPQETLGAIYQDLRLALAQELLERIKNNSPRFFEKLVVDLLVAMGYGGSRIDAGQAVGQSGDGGIDGIINEDRLGLDVVYIQAKRWEGTVGRPVVQAFAGSLMGHSARKGVLISTSRFSKEALDYVSTIQQPKIVLVDGERFAQLMIDHDIGVTEEERYVVKKIDFDYFGDE